ncbi:hypothetical protein FA95DRAFT_1504596, partial [Auriscalpium vulgare]
IVDEQGRILVPLAGQPAESKDWPDVIRQANQQADEILRECDFAPGQQKSKRGTYPHLSMGFSFGGGRKEPTNLKPKTDNQIGAFACLGRSVAFRRFAGFGSASYKLYGPRLFASCKETVQGVRDEDPTLAPPFSNSVFPTATFNFGPQVATRLHRDHLNVPYGWCSVTAFGSYDYKRGGHLILWDLKLVVEFPPGATILLPSALLIHGNTPVQPGETRYSFTQYCAGALTRWHTYGCRTGRQLAREDPALKAKLDAEVVERAVDALAMFSKVEALEGDHGICIEK